MSLREADFLRMESMALIPARGGSRRIPGKNIKPFHGKPIIAYSIEKARASGLFSRIVVSTDDPDIAAVAQAYGAEAYQRPAEYCQDEVGTQEVARQFLQTLVSPPAYLCVIYATAPLMRVQDLRDGYDLLRRVKSLNYVFSVGYPPLQDAGQFYWCWSPPLLAARTSLVGMRTGLIHVPAAHVCDINTEEDFQRALRMYQETEKHE